MTTPFPEDTEHTAWDHDAVGRFGHILDWSDTVLEEFSGWFNGKTSPVHFFWHGFDLAVTRFSGRPSGNSSDDPVTREAYSHEVISFGFWPGDDTHLRCRLLLLHRAGATGLREQPLAVGSWVPSGASSSLAILAYEEVRSLRRSPADTARLLGKRLRSRRASGDWDVAAFTSSACPSPTELRELQSSAAGQFGRAISGTDATRS